MCLTKKVITGETRIAESFGGANGSLEMIVLGQNESEILCRINFCVATPRMSIFDDLINDLHISESIQFNL